MQPQERKSVILFKYQHLFISQMPLINRAVLLQSYYEPTKLNTPAEKLKASHLTLLIY